jgi:hypothetical protein
MISEKANSFTLGFYRFLFFAVLIPYLGILPLVPENILGFNWTGWAWLFMLLVCMIFLLSKGKITLPRLIWIPFIGYTFIWMLIDKSLIGIRFFVQPIVPLLVGLVASGLSYNNQTLIKLFRYLIIFLFILILIIPLFLFIGIGHLEFASAAAIVMTLIVFDIIFLSIYFTTNRYRYLFLYSILLFIPIYIITRTAILLTILILPLHFLNNNIIKKIITVIVGATLTLIIFYSRPVQDKMFISGHGTLRDLSWDNSNFNTNARLNYRLIIEQGLIKRPVFGNGPRADLEVYEYNNIDPTILHNDYLLLRYCYGWVGLVSYLIPFAILFINLYRKKKDVNSLFYRIIWGTSLTLFIPYFGFMETDNIYLYGPWYGYFFFAFIGIVYSLSSNQTRNKISPVDKPTLITSELPLT